MQIMETRLHSFYTSDLQPGVGVPPEVSEHVMGYVKLKEKHFVEDIG
jgi:hypothetical protein